MKWRIVWIALILIGLAGCQSAPADRYELRREALQAMEDGNYEEAVRIYNRLEQIEPENAEVYNGRGAAYLSARQYTQALTDLEKATGMESANAVYWFNLGLCRCCLGSYETGIEAFTRALALDPEYAESYCQRGAAYAHLGQYEKAEADVLKAGEIRPGGSGDFWAALGSAYVSCNDLERAEASYNQAVQLSPEDARLYLERANVYIQMGQYEKAHQDCIQAIGMQDGFLSGYELLGDLYLAQKQYDQAIANYTVALLEEADYIGYLNRGSCYLETGEYEEAEADFTAAILLAPQEAAGYAKRGEVREFLSDEEGAQKDYKTAKRILEEEAAQP